jgi:acetolactate synthase-1/2/3 large subunit
MTEQMTGRKGTAGPESPAGSPAPPASAVPSPRDLAARSPHRDAARDAARAADHSHPADHSHAETPAPAEHAPAQHGSTQPGSTQPGSTQPGPAEHERVPVTSPNRVRATGAQALVYALERVGADVVFGIPGGAVLPAYDPLLDSKIIRHILVRHEQGAGHAATGYAQATGRVGVCMATSGPGATNLVTPIADAYMDSIPLVAITGQVPSSLIGTDGFQEADISGITIPITKHNFLVT